MGDHMEGVSVGEDETDMALQDTALGPVPNAYMYVGKRNFIHQLMDVALMMANVSQLKALLASDNNEYFPLLLTFICLSISLQVVFTIGMLIIWYIEKELEDDRNTEVPKGPCPNTEVPKRPCPKTERKKYLATWLDRVGSMLVLFIIVSNVFIAGFGVENHKSNSSPQQTPQYILSRNGSVQD